MIDPVNLLCDLIEARVGSFDANALRSEAPHAVEFLSKIGAPMPGHLARVLTWRACHDDHRIIERSPEQSAQIHKIGSVPATEFPDLIVG
jgi:hypothetical protein